MTELREAVREMFGPEANLIMTFRSRTRETSWTVVKGAETLGEGTTPEEAFDAASKSPASHGG